MYLINDTICLLKYGTDKALLDNKCMVYFVPNDMNFFILFEFLDKIKYS